MALLKPSPQNADKKRPGVSVSAKRPDSGAKKRVLGKPAEENGKAKKRAKQAPDSEPPLFSRAGKVKKEALQATDAYPHRAEQREKDTSEGEDELRSFKELGITEWLLTSCREMGLVRPTPVQQNCIPHVLAGEDVIACAQTGSGKTAAFALPILQKLAEDPYGIFALVMTPTRELAIQIADQFRALGVTMGLRDCVIIGGMDITTQAVALARRPHVVICTPGRMRDHLQSDPDLGACFSGVRYLVLDEADRLLDQGFEQEMATILEKLPRKRQTLLFSATMTASLKQLQDAQITGRDSAPYHYQAYEGLQTVEKLKQEYCFVPANVKDVYLLHILDQLEDWKVRSAIIFTATCRTCQLLLLLLEELGHTAVNLHSAKSQPRRLAALDRFKSGVAPLLIATDVAARGLDIPTVDLVINYDIPRFARDYVHRVGRTARAGRGGWALSLVTQYDVELVQGIEAHIGRQLTEHATEEKEVLKGITKVYKAKRVASLKMAESGFEELLQERKKQKLGADGKVRRKKRKEEIGKRT